MVKLPGKSGFESCAFAYPDIIFWVEGNVYDMPMSAIIYEKYLESERKK